MTDAPNLIDLANAWLIGQVNQFGDSESLCCFDENFSSEDLNHVQNTSVTFITNRWDLAQALKNRHFMVEFSDFDLQGWQHSSLNHFFYRVSKEKALTHHLINQAKYLLKAEGRFHLVGYKDEGIKTYLEKASAQLGASKQIQKSSQIYFSVLEKQKISSEDLPTQDYTQQKIIGRLNDRDILSKPGQFGWNKIDLGSELLIETLTQLFAQGLPPKPQALDLGCGYGYLSLACATLPIESFVLTDNNAAALSSAQINCQHFSMNAQVLASDAGDCLQSTFDLIICNPPFHQGFNVETDLTNKFLASTKRLLANRGMAFFVVNQFIGLENKASQLGFSTIKTLCQESGFKVVLLEKHA